MAEVFREHEYVWVIPKTGGMRVEGAVFASEGLMVKASEDHAVDQVANVAHLPGIVGRALAMPDIHWGYGFPIGGVAATDIDHGGVVSPGGVGFDIGCGVRLLRSDLTFDEIQTRIPDLANALFKSVPHGVGGKGLLPLSDIELDAVLRDGVMLPLKLGIGWDEDAEAAEDSGRMPGAQPSAISARALERGGSQLGSLGAGNHFLEVQVVDKVFAEKEAKVLGLEPGQVCVMIHSGSRGLGHQVCTEEVRAIEEAMRRTSIEMPDRQLACIPVNSREGEHYLGAMAAAANFARANRHVIAHGVRSAFEEVFGSSAKSLGMSCVYDVSHNVAKIEQHQVGRTLKNLCVHRKGATRSFAPGSTELPERYRGIGQPVLIPGSMGTASWVAVGTKRAAEISFASTCHGAGRTMSRKAALKEQKGEALKMELERQGIFVRTGQAKSLAEEAPYAYKDVDEVVEVCDRLGLSKKVARLRPVAVVKG